MVSWPKLATWFPRKALIERREEARMIREHMGVRLPGTATRCWRRARKLERVWLVERRKLAADLLMAQRVLVDISADWLGVERSRFEVVESRRLLMDAVME
jgi:hypothetical protein